MTAAGASVDIEVLRVLQLIPTTKAGGLERVATTLSLGLSSRVARLVVCSSGGPPYEAVLRQDPAIHLERIPRPRPRPVAIARSAYALARVLRRERPHVLHAHNPAAGAAAALGRLLAGRPRAALVTTYHGMPPGRGARAIRAFALTADLVVGVGPAVTRELQDLGVPAGRCATVLNGIDVEPDRPAADVRREFDATDVDLVVSVGRLRSEKNHILLLRALAVLAARGRRVRALLVGAGALEPALRRQIDELGLGSSVTLTGHRDDAVTIAAAADVFALTSDWEGLPLALLEAMALGRPVVATAVRGVTDLVQHEKTGLLVPPGDATAFAEALERVLDDETLKRTLGHNAKEHVTRTCSARAMVERYTEIYGSVAAQPVAGARA